MLEAEKYLNRFTEKYGEAFPPEKQYRRLNEISTV